MVVGVWLWVAVGVKLGFEVKFGLVVKMGFGGGGCVCVWGGMGLVLGCMYDARGDT